jgi:tagatose 6-phosphate kinase
VILVVSLSPAWQRTLFFNEFRAGEVNRVRRVVETAAGKGTNTARVLTILGAKTRLLTVAGGRRGALFRRALAADGVRARIVLVHEQTRMCQTLIGSGVVTELVEEAPALQASEVKAVLRAFNEELQQAKWLVLIGTVPRGCGDNFCARLARAARQRGVPVALDLQRTQLMRAVRERPTLVKINRAELAAATGKGGVAKLMKLGAEFVVITHGAKPVVAFNGRERWQIQPPRVKAVNPIGSGDAMLAGMVVGMCTKQPLDESVRLGVACGAANALTETSGVVRTEDVLHLLCRC